jgi:hypothetical protein
MINLLYFNLDWLGDVVLNQLKSLMPLPLGDVANIAGIEIIEAKYLMTCQHQAIAQVGTNKTRTTSYQNAHKGLIIA